MAQRHRRRPGRRPEPRTQGSLSPAHSRRWHRWSALIDLLLWLSALSPWLSAFMLTLGLSLPVCNTLRPRPKVSTADWAAKNVYLPPGSEIKGKFRLDLFPHIREMLDCFDDENCESISAQLASRCGKTVFAQACVSKTADINPHPMAWADADQKAVNRVLKRLWAILDKVPGLAGRIPPHHMRSSDRCELTDCLIHGAWSGSPSAAADYGAFVVVLNEIDKMSKKASAEADFAQLMEERAKGYLWSKIIRISTPTIAGNSRIEDALLAGDNRKRYVPCPFCSHYQQLRTGTQTEQGGVKWLKNALGKSDPDIALRTAVYECEHPSCGKSIENKHRYDMLNAGVWVPEGQRVDSTGQLQGERLRDSKHASFGPLSTLHSLLPSTTWGLYASKFLRSRAKPKERQNFTNSWEGLTWEKRPQKTNAHELGKRLQDETPINVCPLWSVFLTQAIDLAGGGYEYHWQVCAWGPFARGHAVAYGIIKGEAALKEHLKNCEFQHADGGYPLRPLLTALDSGSGFHTEIVYALCRSLIGCVPSKGVSASWPEFLRLSDLSDPDYSPRRKHVFRPPGTVLYEINHERSQRWIQSVVDGELHRGRPDCFTIANEIAQGLGESERGPFIQHLLNERPGDEYYKADALHHKWERHGDNEQRDCARINRALAEHLTDNGKEWGSIFRPPPVPTTSPPKTNSPSPFTTPDGRPFLVSNR